MTDFRQYLASPATAERPSAGELDALAARYEWFAPVRIARESVTGICDPRLAVTAPWRAQSSLLRRPIDAEAVLRLSSDDIIDRFLQEDDLRIVAADGEPEEEVRTAAELDDDDEVVSEELAEIYLAQGLCILAVLVQNPKSGMAANFGASNQVMGVRETSDFLEKFTWTMAIAIVVLSLVATLAMDKGLVAESNSEISKDVKALQERVIESETPATMPQAEIPAAEVPAEQSAE